MPVGQRTRQPVNLTANGVVHSEIAERLASVSNNMSGRQEEGAEGALGSEGIMGAVEDKRAAIYLMLDG